MISFLCRYYKFFLVVGTLTSVAVSLPIYNQFLLTIVRNSGGYFLVFHIAVVILFFVFVRLVPITRVFRLFVLLSFVLALEYALVLVPFYGEKRTTSRQEFQESFSIYYANINGFNTNVLEVQRAIKARNPSIVALLEYTDHWASNLELSEYPFQLEIPRIDNFGVALFSRVPFVGEPETNLGPGMPPYIEAELSNGVKLILIHLYPPISNSAVWGSTVMSRRVVGSLREYRGPVVLLGDFNATPFSGIYRRIIGSGFFRDAREGYGLERTWHAGNPLLHYALDHIFVRGGVRVLEFERGAPIGSDHYPLSVTLGVPQ